MSALFVLTSAVTPLMVFGASTPSVGSLAPEFTLTSQEGTPVSLKDYHGKWGSCTSTPRTSPMAAHGPEPYRAA